MKHCSLTSFSLVFLVLLCFQSAKCESDSKYLTCNTTQLECPANSKCIGDDAKKNETNGSCMCISGYKVNDEFKASSIAGKAAKYCKEVPSTTTEIHTTSTSTEAPKPTTTTAKVVVTTTTQAPLPKTTSLPPTAKPTHHDNHTKKPNVTSPAVDDPVMKKTVDPGAQHIFGGIMIPIFVVAAFIGTIFAARKYDLIDRTRAFLRNRRYNSQYNDVIMENDFDDPPLI